MSSARSSQSVSLTRRRAAYRLLVAAIAGLAFGAGLSIGANVPGVVLAVYGIVVALLLVAGVVAARCAVGRSHERPPDRVR
jgi:hypothetical protein